VISMIEKVTGKAVPHNVGPRRPGDPPALVANPSKAQQLLGWNATRGLQQIVSTAWNWMQKQSRVAVH